MRITKDSPLNKIPVNLGPKHILLFDSLRYCINMCFKSWGNLIICLKELSESNFEDYDNLKYDVFMNSWSVVDNLDRLRSLFGVFDKENLDKVFGEPTVLRGLRNSFHHMYDRLETGVDLNFPILGTLSWVFREDLQGNTMVLNCSVSGFQFGTRKYPSINPLGKKIDVPIGLVTLHGIMNSPSGGADVRSVELSDIMHRLNVAVENIEKSWKQEMEVKFVNPDFLLAEMAIYMELQVNGLDESG